MWLEGQRSTNPKTVPAGNEKMACFQRYAGQKSGQMGHESTSTKSAQPEFHADRPNTKWSTDISYIHTSQGVLYLSMIRDLYDNSIVAYKTASQQTVNLVLDTIRLTRGMKKWAAGVAAPQRPGLSIYASQPYFRLTKQYSIAPSMSRRGNCYGFACYG